MPVVKRETSWFEHQKFIIEYRCDRGGVFTADVPEPVGALLGVGMVKAETLAGVQAAWKQAIKDYESAKTSVKKVIAYRVKANMCVMDPNREGYVLQASEEISFAEGAVLSVCAGVFEEKTVTQASGKTELIYQQLGREHTFKGSINSGAAHLLRDRHEKRPACVVDWTPERMALFARLGEAMEKIYLELQKIKDPQRLIALADSGQFLLGNGCK